MDINDLRSLVTVAGLVCFLLIVGWAYSSSAKRRFDEAEMLPFDDGDVSCNSTTRPHNASDNAS